MLQKGEKSNWITQYRRNIIYPAIILMIVMALKLTLAEPAMADDTGFKTPANFTNTQGLSGTSGGYGRYSDDFRTIFDNADDGSDYYHFGLNVTSGASVQGVEVSIEARRPSGNRQFNVSLLRTGSTHWTTAKTTATDWLANSDMTEILGEPTDLWGWSSAYSANFVDNTFMIRVRSTNGSGSIELDSVQVKVYYTPPGITVSPVSGLVTTEAAGTDTFDIVLNSEPTSDVTINLKSSDTSEGSVSPSGITFSAASTLTQTRRPNGENFLRGTWTPGNTTSNWISPTIYTSDTGGDGNGYEVQPDYACSDDSNYAENINGAGDRHQYYGYDVSSLPADNAVVGVEVRLDWWLDTLEGNNSMSVNLSWDEGISWSSPVTDSDESASSSNADIIGGSTFSWGHTWNTNDLSNFRVRITCNSDDGNRDFYLDWVAVRFTYSNRYACVDEITRDDADYITGVATLTGDSLVFDAHCPFAFPAFSIPSEATVDNLTVFFTAKDYSSGYNNIGARIWVNNNHYDGTAIDPGDSWGIYSYSWSKNPNTANFWTADDINGTGSPLQLFGVYSNDLDPDIQVSWVYAEVTYTIPSNWNIPQTITVTGVDDVLDDGDIGYTIQTEAAGSADENYSELYADDVSVTNIDDEEEPVNTPPDAVNDGDPTPIDVMEDSVDYRIDVLANDKDLDGDPLTITTVSNPDKGTAAIDNQYTAGIIDYSPNSNYNGLDSFTYTISDGIATDTATVYLNITPVNDPPAADNDEFTTDEDTMIASMDVLTGDSDPDAGDTLFVSEINTTGTKGMVTLASGVISYDPDGQFDYLQADGPVATDSFVYTVSDGNGGTATGIVNITITPLNDTPDGEAGPATQTTQYSDPIETMVITVEDIDSPAEDLDISFKYAYNSGADIMGLPAGLSRSAADVKIKGPPSEVEWTITGNAMVSAGTYIITATISDGLDSYDESFTIEVEKENAIMEFSTNPVSQMVIESGRAAPQITLAVTIIQADDGYPGDLDVIAASDLIFAIKPVGGSHVTQSITPSQLSTGIFQFVIAAGLPVETYSLEVILNNDSFAAPDLYDSLVVYDPSLGFTTGGGWFYWPDDGSVLGHARTNLGYTLKYNKKGRQLQGELLLIAHLADGSGRIYRIKSNALRGLAINQNEDVATFNGKCIFMYPSDDEMVNIGNQQFFFWVKDVTDPGQGADQLWFTIISTVSGVTFSLDTEIENNQWDSGEEVTLEQGNIFVPKTRSSYDSE